MSLQEELKKIDNYIINDEEAFKRHYIRLKEDFSSKEEAKAIDDYVESLIMRSIEKTDKAIDELTVKIQLMDNVDVIPLAYIARNYFHKTKNWLYQRVNGNIVNGKPAKFTEEEKRIFNNALKDVSRKIGSINIA